MFRDSYEKKKSFREVANQFRVRVDETENAIFIRLMQKFNKFFNQVTKYLSISSLERIVIK